MLFLRILWVGYLGSAFAPRGILWGHSVGGAHGAVTQVWHMALGGLWLSTSPHGTLAIQWREHWDTAAGS